MHAVIYEFCCSLLLHLKSKNIKLIGFVVHLFCVFRNTSNLFERKEEEKNPGGQLHESGRDSAKIRTSILQHDFSEMVAEQVFNVVLNSCIN